MKGKTKQSPKAKLIPSTASVKVMRSYDYCHFEVALSTDQVVSLDEVNGLRKQAAVLVDEAIRQYRIAKEKESKRQSSEWQTEAAMRKLEAAKQKSKSDLTPEEAALLRSDGDSEFWRNFEQDDYYYEEDEEREHHFSMLNKFKKTVVSG